ncbi:putative sulfate exporter family transporter [Sulfurimonas aquatica]|uniref:Sulfate exporter family transporter n=1 Tax=Sulfurimonas aquatica TaxID=2672570 RepID=A0A975GE25_9BACT|nr:putative sulfate exporter family transporter [Sulfurimonas aquatica]QSZ42954.1 putative sulfate exporter family transporter [Sulfurimonas aquatica]
MFNISKYKTYTKGLLASIAVAIVASIITHFISFSTATVAIILGMIVGNYFYSTFHSDESEYKSGVKWAEKDLLMFAIALMGINLNFTMLANLGFKTILIIVLGMAFTIFMGLLLGKLFKLNPKLSLMIGIGNGVCGSSAIAATSGIAKVKSADVGVSIALVNLMGTIGIFLAPALAHLIGFSNIQAGVFTGNTLQAVGQAVAAGFSISAESGHYATVVKMGRVLLLVPLVLILIYIAKRESLKNADEVTGTAKVGVPSFILWFVGFSVVASLGWLPKELEAVIGSVSHYITLIAMSAIGLMIHFGTIVKTAGTAFKVSSLLFALQLIFSALLISLL